MGANYDPLFAEFRSFLSSLGLLDKFVANLQAHLVTYGNRTKMVQDFIGFFWLSLDTSVHWAAVHSQWSQVVRTSPILSVYQDQQFNLTLALTFLSRPVVDFTSLEDCI